jgi:hypothetical protein
MSSKPYIEFSWAFYIGIGWEGLAELANKGSD